MKKKNNLGRWRKGKSGMGMPFSDQSVCVSGTGGEEKGRKVGSCAASPRDDMHCDLLSLAPGCCSSLCQMPCVYVS